MNLEQIYVKLNNQENCYLKLNFVDNLYYEIQSISSNNKLIGFATFSIKKNKCFLYTIRIVEPHHHRIGLGTRMMKYVESICLQHNCKYIEGKYYPEGEGAENARSFYENNGYEIFKEGYETYIGKYLNNEKEK